jgi:hypothetical protein
MLNMKIPKFLTKLFEAGAADTTETVSCRFCGGTARVPKEVLPTLPSLCCPSCANRLRSVAQSGATWRTDDRRQRKNNQPNIGDLLKPR